MSRLGEPATFTTHISPTETGLTATPGNMIAISSSSPHKEAAWEFTRLMLSPMYQVFLLQEHMGDISGMPMRKAILEKGIQYAIDTPDEYQIPEEWDVNFLWNGESKDYRWKYPTKDMEPLSEENAEALRVLIASIDEVWIWDMERVAIEDIVIEETRAFFEGQKTADEVAFIVQDRIRTKLNEK